MTVKLRFLSLLPLALFAAAAHSQAVNPADVDAVAAAVKAANPDFKALCQKGPDGLRKAVTETVMAQVAEGKIKGDPQAVGGQAGQKLGRECRG